MAELEIGLGKSARAGYSLDDLLILPSRRTRDAGEVDLTWQIDAFTFDLPVIAAPMDGVTSPATAAEVARLGGVASLHIEGLWGRHEDPSAALARLAGMTDAEFVAELRRLHEEPVRPELIRGRVAELRSAGATACVAVSPQHVEALLPDILAAEPDLLVIHGTVVSAEHVASGVDPLNLKQVVRRLEVPVIVGGCASYQAALHLMRTGAAGVLVGVGPGAASRTRSVLGLGAPQATAIADARAARMRHLDETGVYVHVIADGGMRTGGDIAKAIVCGADAVMLGTPLAAAAEAPAGGANWSMQAAHPTLPRSDRVVAERLGSLEEVLVGPATTSDGRTNLAGGLRKSMALAGHGTIKDLQKAELVVVSESGRAR